MSQSLFRDSGSTQEELLHTFSSVPPFAFDYTCLLPPFGSSSPAIVIPLDDFLVPARTPTFPFSPFPGNADDRCFHLLRWRQRLRRPLSFWLLKERVA